MIGKKRRYKVIIFCLTLLFGMGGVAYASTSLASGNVEVALNLASSLQTSYSMGFSSNKITTFNDEVVDVSDIGVDLIVSEDRKEADLGGQKLYVWWKVMSAESFSIKVSITPMKRVSTAEDPASGEFPLSLSFTTKNGDEKTINSSDSLKEDIVFKRMNFNTFGESGSVPITIYAKGIEGVMPGDYSGTIKLNLFIGE